MAVFPAGTNCATFVWETFWVGLGWVVNNKPLGGMPSSQDSNLDFLENNLQCFNWGTQIWSDHWVTRLEIRKIKESCRMTRVKLSPYHQTMASICVKQTLFFNVKCRHGFQLMSGIKTLRAFQNKFSNESNLLPFSAFPFLSFGWLSSTCRFLLLSGVQS